MTTDNTKSTNPVWVVDEKQDYESNIKKRDSYLIERYNESIREQELALG